MKLELNDYSIVKNPKDISVNLITIKSIDNDVVKIKGFGTEFKLVGNKLHRKNEVWTVLDTCSNIKKALGGSRYNEDGSLKKDAYWNLIKELLNK